ncbi:MAG: hypothetical protein ACFE96_00190 [Candidatus Hermodarchaeota archaeon]
MDLKFFGILLLISNVVFSIYIALTVIHNLYITKTISKENDFHLYNDLFSWEIFFFILAIEHIIKIISDTLPLDYEYFDLLIRIRILLLFFPFWNKIIHLEKVMDKIEYKRHYFAGIIPFILVLILSFSNLPNIILLYILTSSSFIPYLLLLIFFKNTEVSRKKNLLVILGVISTGLGLICKPEILMLNLMDFISPLLLIIGTIFIFKSFCREIST